MSIFGKSGNDEQRSLATARPADEANAFLKNPPNLPSCSAPAFAPRLRT